jgi:aminoglycoside phosphotransferase (APT) family kinase protein
MSSETVLFDVAWGRVSKALVARIAPDDADVPVFPTYDLDRQFRVIRLVGERTAVPVPTTLWSEPDPSHLGAPFFVMERVDGQVPPDVSPYPFGGNWLFDASPPDQRRLQDRTVEVLAGVHSLSGELADLAFLEFDEPGDTPLRRHVAHTRTWYDFSTDGWRRSPLVERGFAWLDEHWPDETPAVLSWGDSRVGNILYRDFEPVAVLDWEMVGVGPREVDVGWLINAHRVFQGMVSAHGRPGMPDFLRTKDVADHYERVSGHRLVDLDWYLAYAAVQFGIVALRTGRRSIHFGQRGEPDDLDEILYNRATLERLVG